MYGKELIEKAYINEMTSYRNHTTQLTKLNSSECFNFISLTNCGITASTDADPLTSKSIASWFI